jgi:hypothetical protein
MLVRQPVDVGARMRVDSLSVMRSELRRQGAVYTRLRACRFISGTDGSILSRAEGGGSAGPSSVQ